MSQPAVLPVLIIGAGVSGLALAQGLRQAGVPVLAFERDQALNIRSQGYRVRITSDGIAALTALLPNTLLSRLKACCAALEPNQKDHMFNAITSATLQSPLPPQAPSETLVADRTVLRSILMTGLEPCVKFGSDFMEYEICKGGVKAKFSDDSEILGSLLVGADGARSKVRKQYLPSRQFLDTQGRMIYGKTPVSEELTERFQVARLEGMLLIQDRTQSVPLTLLLEPMRFQDDPLCPQDYIYWVLGTRSDHPSLASQSTSNLSPAAATAFSQQLTVGWHPAFRALFSLQDQMQTSLLYINSADPSMPPWQSSSRVTLIGDAVHVMAPTAGVGATTALRDAAELAKVLTEDDGRDALRQGDLLERIRAFEEKMRGYAEEAIRGSARGGGFWFKMRAWEDLPVIEI
ncbi:MAG: hypothetical protein Q9191_004164 [Dirinaria sp. TL-2023a]